MIDVLGLPLDMALERLKQAGVTVSLEETRSRKGVPDGSDRRVIRQRTDDETHVSLVYAVFRPEPKEEANA